MNELRRLWSNDTQRIYYITAAPQCVYPDASLGPDKKVHNETIPTAISHAWFDWLNMQFYNNDCGVYYFNTSAFNFNEWANSIPTINPNPNIKLMLGIPAGPKAGGGYVNATGMAKIIENVRKLPQFAGIMMWDDGYALQNDNFQIQIKKILNSTNNNNIQNIIIDN